MLRGITCYVIFVTLVWGVHTQNEEKDRENMFKSNISRNDFSNLLSSLIKLNEHRVSVLQKLNKLENYGVLREMVRSGDRKLENGNPNNLFLIVMSKNETDPSQRKANFEVVDSVTNLDIGIKKVQPKLSYVLDPANYISQNQFNENSIKSVFANFSVVRGPKKTLIIDDESKTSTTKKHSNQALKHNKPGQRTELKDSNILRPKTTGRKAKKEKKNNKYHKQNNERHTSLSKELKDIDDSSKYRNPPHYPEIFVTKIIANEDTISKNNHDYSLDRDVDVANDYSSSFSKEYIDHSAKLQNTKPQSDNPIKKSKLNRNKAYLNNQANKSTIKKTTIKPTTNKNNHRLKNTAKSYMTDTLSIKNQNSKNREENDYASPFSEEYFDNGPRKYTQIDSDFTTKKVHNNIYPKPKKNTNSPKIQGYQLPNSNRNKSIPNKPASKYYTEIMVEAETTSTYSAIRDDTTTDSDIFTKKNKFNQIKSIFINYGNEYTIKKATIKPTSTNNNLKAINIVNNDKIDKLYNNQNNKFNVQDKDIHDDNYYGSPFSSEYDGNSPIRQNIKLDQNNYPKINVPGQDYPKVNQSNSMLNTQVSTNFDTKTVITTTNTKNDIPIYSTVNIGMASNNTKNPDPNIDLQYFKITDGHSPKEISHIQKFTLPSNANASASDISETTKGLLNKNYNDYDYLKEVGNDSNKDNPGIVRYLTNSVKYGYDGTENITYHGKENLTPPPVISINNDGKITPINSPFYTKDITENSKKDKPTTAKDLRYGNTSNVKQKRHKDKEDKEKYNNHEEFMIGKNNGERISIIVTNIEKDELEEINQPYNHKSKPKGFYQSAEKHIARKGFQKCLNKKATKLCNKSCISAYKNVCVRLKCTSGAKKALKKECKRSCKKTFVSSSSKYSDEGSGDTNSDYSESNYSDSGDS